MLIIAILEFIVTKHKKTSLDNLKLFSGWLLQGIGLCAKFTPVSISTHTCTTTNAAIVRLTPLLLYQTKLQEQILCLFLCFRLVKINIKQCKILVDLILFTEFHDICID